MVLGRFRKKKQMSESMVVVPFVEQMAQQAEEAFPYLVKRLRELDLGGCVPRQLSQNAMNELVIALVYISGLLNLEILLKEKYLSRKQGSRILALIKDKLALQLGMDRDQILRITQEYKKSEETSRLPTTDRFELYAEVLYRRLGIKNVS